MKGKRTYLSIAGVIVAIVLGIAARHGVDLGPFRDDLVSSIALACASAAAYFRAKA